MFFRLWRCLFADLLYLISSDDKKEMIDADVQRYFKWSLARDKYTGKLARLNYCLLYKREYRSVFYFRFRLYKMATWLNDLFLPRLQTIEFGTGDIDKGLMISHYHCVVYPREAGKNFRVGPGVVIGGNQGFPTFGDNVYVAANATVVGDIHIGSNVIIGAGSVVTKDIPNDCVVVGNPARIIRKIGNDQRLLNEII